MDLLGIGTGLKIAGGVGKYIAGRMSKPPKFEKTAYGRYLNEVGQKGAFSPTMRATIMGDVGSAAGNVAAQRVAMLRGRLVQQGMNRSIAGNRLLAEPGLETQRLMAETGRDVTLRNEESKISAREEYAQRMYDNRLQRKQINAQALGNLVGDVTGAGAGYVQAKYAEPMLRAQHEATQRRADAAYTQAQAALMRSEAEYKRAITEMAESDRNALLVRIEWALDNGTPAEKEEAMKMLKNFGVQQP